MKTYLWKSPSFFKTLACALLMLGAAALAHADDVKVDPSGTWTWSNPGRNGNPGRTNVLTLKYEGTSLTGTVAAPTRDGTTNSTAIADGKLTGDQVSFTVSRDFGGNTMVFNYQGTVAADSIKGEVKTMRDGEARTRKWEAKRQTATAP